MNVGDVLYMVEVVCRVCNASCIVICFKSNLFEGVANTDIPNPTDV